MCGMVGLVLTDPVLQTETGRLAAH
jgi:hypothetical protein